MCNRRLLSARPPLLAESMGPGRVALLEISMTAPTKMLISLPAGRKAAYESAAAKDGLSLSEWVDRCCMAGLPESVRRKLPERTGRGRPAKVAEPAG